MLEALLTTDFISGNLAKPIQKPIDFRARECYNANSLPRFGLQSDVITSALKFCCFYENKYNEHLFNSI